MVLLFDLEFFRNGVAWPVTLEFCFSVTRSLH
jgi:hypothetical protein